MLDLSTIELTEREALRVVEAMLSAAYFVRAEPRRPDVWRQWTTFCESLPGRRVRSYRDLLDER